MQVRDFFRVRVWDPLLFLSRKLPNGSLRQRFETLLRGLPRTHSIGCRAARINLISRQMERCDEYLEIGVQYGFTFASVEIRQKTGVDPQLKFNPRFAPDVALHRVSSDEFFSALGENVKYDLIFIDGLHTFKQATRDFINSLNHLRSGGVIVIDDVVPSSKAKALPNREESFAKQIEETGKADGEWFGDVWKLPVAIKELFGSLIEVDIVGFGSCGQCVVYFPEPSQDFQRINETDFAPFEYLRFEDYFSEHGEVYLPGYSQRERNSKAVRFELG